MRSASLSSISPITFLYCAFAGRVSSEGSSNTSRCSASRRSGIACERISLSVPSFPARMTTFSVPSASVRTSKSAAISRRTFSSALSRTTSAHDLHRGLGDHVVAEPNLDRIRTERLDTVLHLDLVAVDRDAELFVQSIGDLGVGAGAEEPSVAAGLPRG